MTKANERLFAENQHLTKMHDTIVAFMKQEGYDINTPFIP